MTREIGDEFDCEGVRLKVVSAEVGCVGCYFAFGWECNNDPFKNGYCNSNYNENGVEVMNIFVEVDK